jgi:hypothetical protein
MAHEPIYPSSNRLQIASVGYVTDAINNSSASPVLFVRGYKFVSTSNSAAGLCSIKFSFTNVSSLLNYETYTCRVTIRYDFSTTDSPGDPSTNSYTTYYGTLVMFPARLTNNSSTSVNGTLNNTYTDMNGLTTYTAYASPNRFYWTDNYVNTYANPTSTIPDPVVIRVTQPAQSTPAINIVLYNPLITSLNTNPSAYNLTISVYIEVVNSGNSSLGVSASTSGFPTGAVQKTF